MTIRKEPPRLTVARLRELLHYDPDTGAITWRVNKGRARAGDRLGTLRSDGYLCAKIDQEMCLLHRVAWAMTTGEWPSEQIDHRDTDRQNNRFANLREANASQNQINRGPQTNNTSGVKNVSWRPDRQAYRVETTVDGVRHWVGAYKTLPEATAAAEAAARRLHGEFGRTA